jgi:hypothetical protein
MNVRVAVALVSILTVAGCSRVEQQPKVLTQPEAEALLLAKWKTAVGLGNTNCTMRFDEEALTLQASGRGLTLRGAAAERCAKSLAAGNIIGGPDCHGDICTATLNEKEASAYCDDPAPCRLALTCGTAKLDDMRVVTEGRHATITFNVKNTVTTSRFDGCPNSPRISDDGSWVAKASLDDAGRWALDDAPAHK